jgi:DTW domain-containing protein YfiP
VLEPREFCYVCRRNGTLCVCEDVKPVPTRTRLIFLQHEEEAWNQIGTARLAHLSLPNSILLEGRDFKDDPRLAAALSSDREKLLLYPTRDAVPVEELDPAGDRDLVIIDGTWAQARNLVNHTPALLGLKRVTLTRGAKSRYRIRLQPRGECISTIEAAVRALAALEGDPGRFEPLLDAFDRMVDRHIARAEASGRRILRDLRIERGRRPLPAPLLGELERLVLINGETLNWRDPETGSYRVDLIQWSAVRPATGEVFDALVRPTYRGMGEAELAYFGLDSFEGALDAGALREAWNAFKRPGDVRFTWGFYAPNAMASLLGEKRPTDLMDLRRLTKVVLNRKVRRPEDALFELDVPEPAPIVRGRCGMRLAALREIVATLRALPRSEAAR